MAARLPSPAGAGVGWPAARGLPQALQIRKHGRLQSPVWQVEACRGARGLGRMRHGPAHLFLPGRTGGGSAGRAGLISVPCCGTWPEAAAEGGRAEGGTVCAELDKPSAASVPARARRNGLAAWPCCDARSAPAQPAKPAPFGMLTSGRPWPRHTRWRTPGPRQRAQIERLGYQTRKSTRWSTAEAHAASHVCPAPHLTFRSCRGAERSRGSLPPAAAAVAAAGCPPGLPAPPLAAAAAAALASASMRSACAFLPPPPAANASSASLLFRAAGARRHAHGVNGTGRSVLLQQTSSLASSVTTLCT